MAHFHTGYIGTPQVSDTTGGAGSNVTANACIAGGVVTSVAITCPRQAKAGALGQGLTNPQTDTAGYSRFFSQLASARKS